MTVDLEADHWIYSAVDEASLSNLDQTSSGGPDTMTAPNPVAFLTAFSAQSVISQLRQTAIAPAVIHHINLLLDEIIYSLISTAQSIHPKDLRTDAVPKVFSAGKNGPESTGIRSLARECTGEAELELRSWYEINPGPKKGFPPANSGRGMMANKEAADADFPVEQAVAIMRLRVSELSSFSPPVSNYDEIDAVVLAAWKAAGGDPSPNTLEPAASWIHALVERICENLLSQLNRVMERDSSRQSCGPHDLYTALAEDERFWGWFARMKVKGSLDEAMKAATRAPKHLSGTSPNASRIAASSGMRESSSLDSFRRKKTSSPISDGSNRGSSETNRLGGIASVTRKTSTMSKRFNVGHDRKDSGLSVSTRSNLGNQVESEEAKEDADEFDALVRSGETMKVSLTPSRLRTFETGRKSQPSSPQQPTFERERPRTQPSFGTTEPVPPLPRSDSGGFSGSPRNSPAKHGAARGRATSGARLTPRAATTIEERTDEEASPRAPGRQPKKESLKELFDSEPAEEPAEPSAKRTVPALILGGPPPGHTMQAPAEIKPETTFSNRDLPAEPSGFSNRDPAAPRSRRATKVGGETPRTGRSEAQELADFFNSTPPPPPEPKSGPSTASSVKSSRGLRGLMSKVTGSSKKKEEEARLARENAAFDIPTAPQAQVPPRHKKSAASVSTIRTAQAIPHHPSYDEDAPAPPTKLKKRPETTTPSGLESPYGGVTVTQAQSSGWSVRPSAGTPSTSYQTPGAPMRQSSLGVTSAVEGASTTPADVAVPMNNLVASVPRPDGPPLQDESTTSPSPKTPHASSTLDAISPTVQTPSTKILGITPPVRKVLPVLGPAVSASTDSLTAPSRAGHSDRSPSDSHSFKTADEGEEEVHEVEDNASTIEQAPESELEHRSLAPEPEIAAPSVALSRLVPARGLLRHATTVEECHMLLSAYLSQIGVPHHPDTDGVAEHTAEAKVTAWLLGGEEGPPVQWPWSPVSRDSTNLPTTVQSPAEDVEVHEGDNEGTPRGTPRQRPIDIEKGRNNDEAYNPPSAKEFNDEEELMSETASMASLSQEDETLPPSFATSAMRSPVRLSTIGHPSA